LRGCSAEREIINADFLGVDSLMNIGQICHIYHPHIGGVENYVYRLTKSIEHRGHNVNIYTTDLSIQNTKEREENTKYCKTNFVILRNPISREFAKKIKSSNEDIYHLHSPWFITSFTASRILRKKPKVMTVHSAEIVIKDVKSLILNKVYYPFATNVLKDMNVLMVQGQIEKKRLLSHFDLLPERIKIVPNAIEINKFDKSGDYNKFIEKYNLREESFKILYVSRLVEAKNQIKLISALTKYIEDKDIEVVLIGEGDPSYISRLKSIADERVHILGSVSFEDLVAAYHSADLFVFLGTWEGMPTVILEAMLCGLPILTTPVGGIPDIVTEGKNGLFVKVPIEEKDLVDRIKYFINDVDINKMSKANIEKVKTQYNWNVVANKILDVYNEVLEEYK
jgi:glycosyltransferase involved in cell wall biosynthesis